MKKIAIIHPQLLIGGGSEAVPLWIAEALRNDYDVYLIAMGEVELHSLNDCYGTNLNGNEIKVISIPIPYALKKRFDVLRSYKLAKFCKKHASDFNLMISTYNVMDFGKKGIQCIADFSFDDKLRQSFDSTHSGTFYKRSPWRWAYLKIGELLAGTDKDGWRKNITIANSDWSGKIVKKFYGIETNTIYPPVVSEFPCIPWDKRENGFVVLARLSPEKRIEKIIEILEKVRQMGFDIHLHILGREANSEYVKRLRKLYDEKRDWVFMEGLVVGQKKLQFIAQHKFSISARDNEPFGISIAETVKAGCITWVPHGGGQTEIVNHSELIYDNLENAVDKIEQVLGNKALQNQLQIHLAEQSNKFSIGKFQSQIRELVHKFLNENAKN